MNLYEEKVINDNCKVTKGEIEKRNGVCLDCFWKEDFKYVVLYEECKTGRNCKIRVGNKRFIELKSLELDTMKLLFWGEQDGEMLYVCKKIELETKNNSYYFNAESFLKQNNITFSNCTSEQYKLRKRILEKNSFVISRNAFFEIEYLWMDISVYVLKMFFKSQNESWKRRKMIRITLESFYQIKESEVIEFLADKEFLEEQEIETLKEKFRANNIYVN